MTEQSLSENIKIINADCVEFMKTLQDKSVDLILSDPPYGVNLKYDIYQDTPENWFELMNKVIPEMRRVANMVIFPCCQIGRLDWYYLNHKPDWLLCWDKGSPGTISPIGFNDWEVHIVYGKNKGVQMHDHFRCPNNEKMGNYGHPCPKPLRWAEWIISRATRQEHLVMDIFMGSGTVGVAAAKLNRKFIGIDISPEYYKIAGERIKREISQQKLI